MHDELLEFVLSHPKQGKPRGKQCLKAEGIRRAQERHQSQHTMHSSRVFLLAGSATVATAFAPAPALRAPALSRAAACAGPTMIAEGDAFPAGALPASSALRVMCPRAST